jgi:hypothetical protein
MHGGVPANASICLRGGRAAADAGVVSVVVVNVPVRKVPAAAATAATEVGGK